MEQQFLPINCWSLVQCWLFLHTEENHENRRSTGYKVLENETEQRHKT